jgi:putative Holliday junction resolvase
MRLLGIDFGSRRVGVAISDEDNIFAMPMVVLQNDSGLVSEILKVCKENRITGIVIGESKNYKGENNPIMERINAFKKELEAEAKLPVYFEPEFLTSSEAERLQGKNEMLDASAAAIILKSYLDRKNNQ